MEKRLVIKQLPGNNTCQWHKNKEGQKFNLNDILPEGLCPWLYNSLYPYFLGLLYGAKFKWNEEGDCNVCCPAAYSVDTIVRKRDNDGTLDHRISEDMAFVIFAEVVKVNGDCPYGHFVEQKIIFPTCMPEYYMCPGGFHNIFPFIKLEPPSCINTNNLKCPDWDNVISYDIGK